MPWVRCAVEVIGDHRLRLTFEDGGVGEVEFSEREWRRVFEPLRDPTELRQQESPCTPG